MNAFSCGNCGATFDTRTSKRRHKRKCGRVSHSTPEIRARADAEWVASDDLGRLPLGWIYRPEQRA